MYLFFNISESEACFMSLNLIQKSHLKKKNVALHLSISALSFLTIRSEKYHSALHHGFSVTFCQKLVAGWRWSFKCFWYSFKGP